MARADRVGDPLHRMTGLEQAGDRLQHADVRLAAGDDERVAAGRQAAQEALLGGGREVELGERACRRAPRSRGTSGPRPSGFCSVPMTWMPSSRGRGRELDAAANDGLAVVDRRHQRRLGVDDEQRGLVGFAESASSAGLLGMAHSGCIDARLGTIDADPLRRPRMRDPAGAYAEFYRRSLEQTATRSGPSRPRSSTGRPFATVCDDSRPPFARWFVGGTTNLCHNAVDRHLGDARRPARADLRLDRDRPGARLQLSPSCTPRCSAWRRCCSRSASAAATGC